MDQNPYSRIDWQMKPTQTMYLCSKFVRIEIDCNSAVTILSRIKQVKMMFEYIILIHKLFLFFELCASVNALWVALKENEFLCNHLFLFQNNPIILSDFTIELLGKNLIKAIFQLRQRKRLTEKLEPVIPCYGAYIKLFCH